MRNNKGNLVITFLIIILSIVLYIPLREYAVYSFSHRKLSPYSILIDLEDERLYLLNVNTGKAKKSYPISTAEDSTSYFLGTWQVESKSRLSNEPGTGVLTLNIPWGKYRIHGTNRLDLKEDHTFIGRSTSHQCIKMLNKDLEDLYTYVEPKTFVVIYGGSYDSFENFE